MKEYFFLIKEFLSSTETIVHPIKKPDRIVKIESLCYPALIQLLIQTHTSEWAVLASGLLSLPSDQPLSIRHLTVKSLKLGGISWPLVPLVHIA